MKTNEILPQALYDYLADANTDLFDTPVVGAEVYRYDYSTERWNRTHTDYIDDLVYSYGYYFGLLRVNPNDGEELYIAGVPLLNSKDGGATWTAINPENVHADHHALWVSPQRKGHLINGNDGGINISYDNGKHFSNCNSPAVGQFYTVAVDDASPYRIYGGLQDNGSWRGPSNYEASNQWLQTGDYPYKMLLGGDGMQIAIDPRDNETVYSGYQFGHYYRLRDGEPPLYIHPMHKLGEKPLRWNWQTPIHLSTHNPDILYMGSNKLHRSLNRGEQWEAISKDLTQGGQRGNVPYGTLTSIDESPLIFGQLIAGSDDGLVWIKELDKSWREVSQNFPSAVPQGLWVTRVEASTHEANRCYITLSGYRQDHHAAYVLRSDDLGHTWTILGADLPTEAVNVILEDPSEENLIYLGTDHGCYVSLDQGASFEALMTGLPQVAIHDMVIQESTAELVIGTHGRSIYVADIALLRELDKPRGEIHVFDVDSISDADNWGSSSWSRWFGAEKPSIDIYVNLLIEEGCTLSITDTSNNIYHSTEVPQKQGLQKISYNCIVTEPKNKKGRPIELPKAADDGEHYLAAGAYSILLTCPSGKASTPLVIE